MANLNNDIIEPVDGSIEVPRSEAGNILKAHGYKVVNNGVDSFVSLKDINKIYPNGVQAVYDFNIDIKEKDFIVLVGPSGCGKSTTLRMIAGLEDITSGYLYIDKVLSNYLPSKNRDISMVFQSYALYPQMTVYDNIAFPLRIRRYRRVMTAAKNLAWNEVLAQLQEPSNFIQALRGAQDKSLNFGTVIEYVATKLNISDLASKILCSYNVTSVADFDKKNENGQTLYEVIKATAFAQKEAEIADLRAKGYTVDDEFRILKDGVLQYRFVKLTKEEIRKKVFEAAEILDLGPYLDRRPKELSGGQMQRVALGRAIVRNAKLFLMDEPLSNLDAKLRVQMRSEIVRIHEQIGATTIYVTHDQTEAMTMATKIAVMSKGWVQQIGTPQEIYYNPKNIFVATFIGSPAMNIFEGEYEDGYVTFRSGLRVKMADSFVERHNNFYKDKIADLERMLELDDFIKMKALKVIDESLFGSKDHSDAQSLGKNIELVLQNAHLLGDECFGKVNSLVGRYLAELDKLTGEYQQAMIVNSKLKLQEIKEIVSTIKDNFGQEALLITETELENFSEVSTTNYSLNTYFGFVRAVEEAVEYVKSLAAGNRALLAALNKLHITDKLPKEAEAWLKAIRKPLLTFEKLSSSDIGKLHNAQVFNQNEKQEKETLYYQKPKKQRKEHVKVKVNLNSVDVQFINNLYEVAVNLLEASKKALAGKHSVRIGIRPEDIHLNNEYAESNKSEAFKITSGIVELLGSELLIHSEFAGANMIAKISTGTLVKPHTEVELTMNKDKILVFDESCGDTI